MKNAPNSVIYSVAIVFVTIIAAFVALSITGSDTAELRSFLNTVLNFASVILGGGAFIAAGAAAKSAGKAEQQTNGQMHQTIRDAVADAVANPDVDNTDPFK
jgi:hypothetical protein